MDGEGANCMISWMLALPAGVQVAVTVPLFGELVTPTGTAPDRDPPTTLTQRVWLPESPQFEFAYAGPATRNVDPAASNATTRRRVHGNTRLPAVPVMSLGMTPSTYHPMVQRFAHEFPTFAKAR